MVRTLGPSHTVTYAYKPVAFQPASWPVCALSASCGWVQAQCPRSVSTITRLPTARPASPNHYGLRLYRICLQ